MQDPESTRIWTPPLDARYRLARYLSIGGHPFIALPLSLAAIARLRGGDVRSAAAVGVLFVAVSASIVAGIAAGRFNDFDVSERRRRPGFYVLLTGGALALAVWLREEPAALCASSIASAMLAACGVLNRWMKVSLHTAFALYATGLWGAWSGVAGLTALATAAAVAWSRVQLGRHSRGEVLTGAAVGAVGGALLISFASLMR